MAWEEFNRHGRRGMSGDKPIDEMSIALARITKSYNEHYSRKPTIHEVLHALTVVLRANAAAYIEDPDIMEDHVAVLGPLPRPSR